MFARAVPFYYLLVLVLTTGPALADGMMIPPSVAGSEAEIQATEQRALITVRDGLVEVTIEPVFDRTEGAGAWVVPFPVQPVVTPGDGDVLEQLNLLTSPIFVELCYDPSCGCYCGEEDGWGSADTVGGGSWDGGLEGVDPSVQIWEQGTVGALDYVILSTAGGDSLVQWLGENGFPLPAPVVTALETFETEDTYFFVAKITAGADPAQALAPVRFALPGLTAPFYPMRLTRAGVQGNQTLGLTLWVVMPDEPPYVPSSHGWGMPDDIFKPWYWYSSDEYGTQLHEWLQETGEFQQLAMVYSQRLARNVYVSDECVDMNGFENYYYYYYDEGPCLTAASVPSERVPGIWAPGIQEILINQERVLRWEARFKNAALASDIEFTKLGQEPLSNWEVTYSHEWGNVYANETGPCYTCSPCNCGGGDVEPQPATDIVACPDSGLWWPGDPYVSGNWYERSPCDPPPGLVQGYIPAQKNSSSGCTTSSSPVYPIWVLAFLALWILGIAVARNRRAHLVPRLDRALPKG